MWTTEEQVLYLYQSQEDSALSLTSFQACSEVCYLEKQINYSVFLNHEAKCFCHAPFVKKKTEAPQLVGETGKQEPHEVQQR